MVYIVKMCNLKWHLFLLGCQKKKQIYIIKGKYKNWEVYLINLLRKHSRIVFICFHFEDINYFYANRRCKIPFPIFTIIDFLPIQFFFFFFCHCFCHFTQHETLQFSVWTDKLVTTNATPCWIPLRVTKLLLQRRYILNCSPSCYRNSNLKTI